MLNEDGVLQALPLAVQEWTIENMAVRWPQNEAQAFLADPIFARAWLLIRQSGLPNRRQLFKTFIYNLGADELLSLTSELDDESKDPDVSSLDTQSSGVPDSPPIPMPDPQLPEMDDYDDQPQYDEPQPEDIPLMEEDPQPEPTAEPSPGKEDRIRDWLSRNPEVADYRYVTQRLNPEQMPDRFTRQIAEQGVPIPLLPNPVPHQARDSLPNLEVLREHSDAMISAMLRDGVIAECDQDPIVSSPVFFIPKKTNELRLIWDGHYVNGQTKVPPKFSLKGPTSIRRSLAKLQPRTVAGGDLADAFYTIPVQDDLARKFFTFKYRGVFYYFRVLPMGWSWSPFYLHVLIEAAIRPLRSAGVQVTHFYDDINLLQYSRRHWLATKSALEALGFTWKKTKFYKSSTTVNILGFIWDLPAQRVSLQTGHVHASHKEYDLLMTTGRAQHLASLLGYLAFFNLIFRGLLSYVYSSVYWQLGDMDTPHWKMKNIILEDHESRALLKAVDHLQGLDEPWSWPQQRSIYGDASLTGLGFFDEESGEELSYAVLEDHYIFHLETLAFHVHMQSKKKADYITDCLPLYYAIKKGRSRSDLLNAVIQEQFHRRCHGQHYQVYWVASEDNLADGPSRRILPDLPYLGPTRNTVVARAYQALTMVA